MDKKDFFKTKPLNEKFEISFIPEEEDFAIVDKKESYLIIIYQLNSKRRLYVEILVDKREIEFSTDNEIDQEYINNHQNFEESKKLIKQEAVKYLDFLQEKYKVHFLKNVFKEINYGNNIKKWRV